MTVFFVDTSALAKRYLAETGSKWMLSWIEPPTDHIIAVSELATVEMFSLLATQQREGKLSAASTAALQADFMFHLEREYLVVLLERQIVQQARILVDLYPLRTLDAIQLASAGQAASILDTAMTFVSADERLLEAARAEGFASDNPNDHP